MEKFLHRPINPFIIHQLFGQNKACVPIEGTRRVIYCDGNNPPEGWKSVYGPDGHKGIDLQASHGQPVYCACAGVVDSIDTSERSGLDVRVVSEVNGKKYKHIYEHLLGYQPKKGDRLQTGDLIGWADNTGWSSGDHLHFEVQELRGTKWVSIDPMPHMFDALALHVSLVRRLKEAVALLTERFADRLRRTNK